MPANQPNGAGIGQYAQDQGNAQVERAQDGSRVQPAGPKRLGKKLKRYTELQNTTLSMSKFKFLVEKVRECQNNVTPIERQYLVQHLQAFHIELEEFLGVVERLHGDIEKAFERIKNKKQMNEADAMIRRKSLILKENLDRNSSYIHDMAMQSVILFAADFQDENKNGPQIAAKDNCVEEAEDEDEDDEFDNFEIDKLEVNCNQQVE